ncbi:ADP,ATP carrier protein 3, mitochondrial-like [Vigna unguiculata]|uniref:ADP,ATP carrier protein 3, mitochondrial-like n=1 Tax=Vigna unguiculata TaxID=3917 RepID=UPI001017198A|nr:ADP,ATP carrier protein 3, mitochondrial-like [Vigna unguiculata]
MAYGPEHPSVVEKLAGQSYLVSSLSPNFQSMNYSAITVNAPTFMVNFLMSGVYSAVSKTAIAPIERVKLLNQNQNEMIKTGRLSQPYRGIGNCFARTIKNEGVITLWRGNSVNAIRYFRAQDRWFACFLVVGGFTISSLASYPIDTVRRRMMMTSGEAVKYKSSLHAFQTIVAKKGTKSLFKGFDAHILCGAAGVVVVASFDKLQLALFEKEYGYCGEFPL